MLPKILSSAMWLDLFFSLPRWTGSRAFPFPPEPCCYSASAAGKEPPQLCAALGVTSPQEPLQFVGACQRDVFHSSKQHRYYRPLPTVCQESLAIWDVMLRGQRYSFGRKGNKILHEKQYPGQSVQARGQPAALQTDAAF